MKSEMGSLIVGVDPSSAKFALAIGTDKGRLLEVKTYKLPSPRAAACTVAHDVGASLSDRPEIGYVMLEAPVMGRGGPGSTIPQAMTSGAFQAGTARSRPLYPVLVNNSQWKKVICKHGNYNKGQITEWLLETHPEWSEHVHNDKGRVDQDIVDALCIYLYGVRHLRVTRKLTAMMKKVRK